LGWWGCLGVGWGFYVGLTALGVVVGLTQGFLPQRAKALVGDPVRPGLGYGRAFGVKQVQTQIPFGNDKQEKQLQDKQQPIQWSIRCAQDDESIGDAGFCKNKQQQRQIRGFLHCAALRSK